MRRTNGSDLLAVLFLSALLLSSPILAQEDDLDDVDRSYSEYGADTDEIMEVDDALTDEARAALEAREAGMDKETIALLRGIKWLGHASFLIEDEKTIYIDPFDLPEGLPKADLILVTHGHRDHLSPQDILKILKPDTKIVTVGASQAYLPEEAKHTVAVTPRESVTVEGVNIEVIPAYNKSKSFHPKDSGDAGYVVHLKDRTVYHAGDTDFIDEMKNLKADIALLPAGGKYTMDAEEAAAAANAIKPRVAVPMHWGTIVGSQEDAEKFVAMCKVPAVILDVYTPATEAESEKE
jgi:L-ascorbate metabolism protein UlaG (beta-lactamase superfamily)